MQILPLEFWALQHQPLTVESTCTPNESLLSKDL